VRVRPVWRAVSAECRPGLAAALQWWVLVRSGLVSAQSVQKLAGLLGHLTGSPLGSPRREYRWRQGAGEDASVWRTAMGRE
jgi:hypothetical protein